MSLDNYDLYNDDETTSETTSLGDTEPEEDTLEEAYVPGSGDSSRSSGKNNRIFMIALGVLAAVFIIAIVGMIIFASINLPQRQQAMTQTAFAISMGNEATIMAATSTADAFAKDAAQTREAAEATPTDVVPTPTKESVEPTATEQVVVQPTEELQPTEDQEQSIAQTATISALLTQVAAEVTPTEELVQPTLNAAQLTATAQAAEQEAEEEELPDTGFMDDGGLYLVAGTALVLVAIIVVVRRLRKG
ncbi:MAG: LPXTG cell wall anchor domain-containing protein [Anaerolineae bacterium]|nr:LPXTG cell wall anchor domain-containing protein [Anaerolineae bacterium]